LLNTSKYILFWLLTAIQFLYSATTQTHIPNGIWVPIGINSIHEDLELVSSWNANLKLSITDIADDKFTHITSTKTSYGYALPSGMSSFMDPLNNKTIFNSATISIFAIKNSKGLNGQTLDGTEKNSVHIKLSSFKPKRNIPMHTMYIEGLSTPSIRIVYQADYEGDKLQVKFGRHTLQNPLSFYTYFSTDNTYSNPAKLYSDTVHAVGSKTSVPIKDAIDFNITDNNITSMSDNTFNIKKDLKPYSSKDSLIAYRFNEGYWDIFNSNNVKGNDFTSFEVGKAYWIKAESENANNDNNFTKIGLITDSVGSINQSVYENMSSGWNLATFSDDYRYADKKGVFGPTYSLTLRYSPTSMFIPSNVLEVNGINLFFRPFSSDVSIFDQNITLHITPTGRYRNTTDVAQGINIATVARNKFYNEYIKLRAFPAMNRAGDKGVIVISNRSFEVNSSNSSIVTLSGHSLVSSGINRSFAPYGDYLLASKLTNLSNAPISASIQVNFHLISSKPVDVVDLNTSNNLIKLNKIYNGLVEASKDSSGTSRANSDAYLIALDFNSSQNYNNESLFSSIIVGSSEKMNLKDTTYVKIFKYNLSGVFSILGEKNVKVSLPNENNITRFIDTINANTQKTGVRASELNTTSGNYFIIYSTKMQDLTSFDLRKDKLNLFSYYISLGYSVLPNQGFVHGALGTIYTHANILDSTLNIDKDVLYGLNTKIADYGNINLLDINEVSASDGNGSIKFMPFYKSSNNLSRTYAPSFPSGNFYSFPLMFKHAGKKVTNIISQEISANGTPYWEAIDLTRSPQDWLGRRDYGKKNGNDFDIQSLLHIRENKSYWVRVLNSSVSRSLLRYELSNNKVVIKKSFINYFDNNVSNTGEINIENHIFHKITFKFGDKQVGDYVARKYNINMQLGSGNIYDFSSVENNDFELLISDIYMPIYDGKHNVLLKSNNEIGDNLLGQITATSIDFEKPPSPDLVWLKNELVVNNIFRNEKVEAYYEYISEDANIRAEHLLKYPQLYKNDILKWRYGDDKSTYGGIKKIAIVLNRDGLYSNAKVVLYAPLNSGHILALDNKSDVHSTKKSYSLDKKVYKESMGVQLTRLDKAKLYKQTVKLLYNPNSDMDVSAFSIGVPNIVYLRLKNSQEPIASISYTGAYANSIFYFEYKSRIYQGMFPVSSGKILEIDPSRIINIFNFNKVKLSSKDTSLLRIDYSPSVSNAQKIIIK